MFTINDYNKTRNEKHKIKPSDFIGPQLDDITDIHNTEENKDTYSLVLLVSQRGL
jgi:hypothetical protein